MFQAIKTSGLWFRVPVTLQNSYEVKQLNQIINKGKRKKQTIYETIGRLIAINCEFVLHGECLVDPNNQRKSYRIRQMTAERLEELMGCQGIAEYLVDQGWLEFESGEGFSIGEFYERKIKTKSSNFIDLDKIEHGHP